MQRATVRTLGVFTVVIVSMVLSGCFRLESTFDISEDGTVDIGVLTAFDLRQLEELAELFGQDGSVLGSLSGEELLQEFGDGTDPCADIGGSLTGYDVIQEEIVDGDLRGVGCTVQDVPVDEIVDFGDDTALAIVQNQGTTSFELRLGGVSELTGGLGEDLAIPGFDADDLFEIRFSATAPGSLDETNATSTDGATATWELTQDASFVEGNTAVMRATWQPGGGSSDNGWIVSLVVVFLLTAAIGAVVLVVVRRSRRSGSPLEHPGGTVAGPSGPPSSSTPPPRLKPGEPIPPPPDQPGSGGGADAHPGAGPPSIASSSDPPASDPSAPDTSRARPPGSSLPPPTG